MRPDLNVVGLIEDRVVKGQPAGAVNVNVTEADVARRMNSHRVRERGDDAKEMEVGEGEVAGMIDVQGQGGRPFATFFFSQQSVEFPVGNVAQFYFVAN